MSSNDEDEREYGQAQKKRRGRRPCDMCRQKKRMWCLHLNTTVLSRSKRQDAVTQKALQRTGASNSHTQVLEDRVKRLESLLADSTSASAAAPSAIRGLNRPLTAPYSNQPNLNNSVEDTLQSLSINHPNQGFQGRSSQAMLVEAVVDLKSKTAPTNTARGSITGPSRPWSARADEVAPPQRSYAFPEPDLLHALSSLYFTNINLSLPTLHRPTFEKALAQQEHLHDDGFARTVLLVCALGACYSDDPRIYSSLSSGGTAGAVVRPGAAHPVRPTDTLRSAVLLFGLGIRLAQDVGAHRSKRRTGPIRPEDELEKRVYWVMVLLDAQCSAALGRSLAIQSHDFDLEPPIACDDTYWGTFAQPHATPSSVDYLVAQLDLNRILSFALKILYSNPRIKSLLSTGDSAWEQKLVVEFDSALNAWFDALPPHLHWDAARSPTADPLFFDQSAALYLNYCLTRILLHRPLIPRASRGAAGVMALPSLTICTNAARACAQVAEVHLHRRPGKPILFGQTAVFTAAVVLLLDIWGRRRTSVGSEADLSDVRRCMDVLRAWGARCTTAIPLLETLEQLIKIERAPAPPATTAAAATTIISPSEPDVAPPVFNPTFRPETLDEDELNWLNHHDGAVEAPARAQAQAQEFAASTSAPEVNANPTMLEDPPFSGASANGPWQMDVDMAALWSAAPAGFEMSDWDSFLSNFGSVPLE
ncbi:hypothetical protein C8R46DRAFT_1344590 [Mycena filopes]|nr:hypothetical protein C8R46DRAFT_1344590 [Mycena filopes]